MISSKFSNILLDKSPKNINNISERILDTLFTINEVVRELNSIDFCNPLGYILTKSLPPDGFVDNLLKEYGKKVTSFINKSSTKFELNNNNDDITNDIEELRLSLEDLILPEELKDIIPGGDGLTKLIQDLNDSLVITNTLLSNNDKKQLIKSFTNRLIPLSNPVSLTELLISNQADSLNKNLSNFIKPERFRSSLIKLIKLVIIIDKSIERIKNITILINKIIKAINTLIKIFKISAKILKKIPMPAKYVTVGMTVTSSSKVSKFESDINELQKLLNAVSKFLDTSVIKIMKRIRNEIFILLIGLNQLLENLNACSYFEGDVLVNNIQNGISSLKNNIITLEELFPSIKVSNNSNQNYKGYNITIVKEETTDNNTTLFRKRVIVSNSQDIIEFEGTPTYSNKDQILIKEGQYYIDSKEEINIIDSNNSLTDEDIENILNDIGMRSNSISIAIEKENEINKLLQEQINQNPTDIKIYNIANENKNINPNPEKVNSIRRIINSISQNYNNSSTKNSRLFQVRLQKLKSSLLEKGYTQEEIQAAFTK